MKRLVVVFGLIVAIAVAVVVTFSKSKADSRSIRTNLLGFEQDVVLDPAFLRFVQEYFVLDNVTAKLVGTGSNGEYVNDLAETINFSEDRKTIKITIKDAVFSDGTPITATDVAASFKRSVILGSPHTNIENLWVGSSELKTVNDDIEGIQVLSPKVLELRLVRATKELLFFMSLTDLAVLHKTQYLKDKLLISDWMSVTSGAYRVAFNEQGTLVLRGNTNTLNLTETMADEVSFESYKGDDVIARLKDKSLDFGVITFKGFLKNVDAIENVKGFDIIGDKADGIVHLTLNVKSGIFSKKENRQWVQKKILEGYKVDKKYKTVTSKAHQFFLPEAKGYIPESDIPKMLPGVNLDKIPVDLKNGFTIKAISGMAYYLPENFDKHLSDILGVSVKVDTSVSSKDYMSFIEKREFEATLMGVGMSYKVLGEALNLQYLSKNPMMLDPSGKIRSLLSEYQKEENEEKEQQLISQILEQMVVDSECVPLFYFSSPFFVKKDSIEASSVNLDESIKFNKIVVK